MTPFLLNLQTWLWLKNKYFSQFIYLDIHLLIIVFYLFIYTLISYVVKTNHIIQRRGEYIIVWWVGKYWPESWFIILIYYEKESKLEKRYGMVGAFYFSHWIKPSSSYPNQSLVFSQWLESCWIVELAPVAWLQHPLPWMPNTTATIFLMLSAILSALLIQHSEFHTLPC